MRPICSPIRPWKKSGCFPILKHPIRSFCKILLVGQYELSHKLGRPEMRHLRWRINVGRFLSPLNFEETIQYADTSFKTGRFEFIFCFRKQMQ